MVSGRPALSWARRRVVPGGAAGNTARYVAPAVFLLAVTGIVLLVRSSLRSDRPAVAKTPTAVTTRSATAQSLPRPSAPKRYYVIASGDTLDAIAPRLGTTVEQLLLLNPGIEPTALTPGEQIRVR
jgi:LysM repeat protein